MPRPFRLRVLSLPDLRSELARRQRRAGTLAKRRDRLQAQGSRHRPGTDGAGGGPG